ncbi:extracellular solute-binding protein [Gluconacetobacter azotocaptans]|uniref:Extracellular solute-binding protein n=1 Tax=Gluconacetobacter azotocaptans TaxID=142834 RepID=A0A7W4JT04_9PROT|nr:extracellular solute-binding protein [Gluconacetobacter azotocaptans]MBB2190312.1 extracellular solute-binding protein [Gluconacetobacter azotocaptans]GBQ27479.1 extracellular solute-binding protein [Gluconacetobacter azotocaptans DSM 13594]
MTGVRVAAAALLLLVLWCLASLAGGRGPGLVIYSSVGAAPAVVAAYARETGRPATVLVMSGGMLLARVSAEAHHPRWDAVWFEGDDGAVALDRTGLLAHGMVPDLDWTPTGRDLLPADGSYEVTGFTLAGVFLSRRDQAHAPRNWRDVMGAARVGMANPALSGPAYPLLAGMLALNGGWPAGRAALRQMVAGGLLVGPSNPSVLMALRAGRIGIAIVQSTAAMALARANPDYVVDIPSPAFVLAAVAAVAADRPSGRRQEAASFLRFIMRPDIQSWRMRQPGAERLFWPVTTRPAQPDLPDAGAIALSHPDPEVWGPRQAEVTGWFQQEIMR